MRVLLVQPPHIFGEQARLPEYFPIGLGMIAQALLDCGQDVDVMDIWAGGMDQEGVVGALREKQYDLVGISAISTQYAYIKWLTRELKAIRDVPIILGNALATFSAETVLANTGVDVCVIGEGEITIRELVQNWQNKADVAGIVFKTQEGIFRTPARPYIEDLDTLGYPAWDLFPMDVYLKNSRVFGTNVPAMNIVAGRGCPYSCKFCSKTFSGVRFRSIDNIVSEIKYLKQKFGIGGIFFNDELVLINRKRTLELCEKIRPLEVIWNCQGRVNVVDYDLLKKMKDAGCVGVGYGVESGSLEILKRMGKKAVTPEKSLAAIRQTVRAGMVPIVQMMYGYPGENVETIKETTDFFRKTPFLGRIDLSVTTPIPGAELYDQAIKEGRITDEDKFLESLAPGYIPTTHREFINFTDMPDEEYTLRRIQAEKQIYQNQVAAHPVGFFMSESKRLARAINKYGMFGTLRVLTRRLVG